MTGITYSIGCRVANRRGVLTFFKSLGIRLHVLGISETRNVLRREPKNQKTTPGLGEPGSIRLRRENLPVLEAYLVQPGGVGDVIRPHVFLERHVQFVDARSLSGVGAVDVVLHSVISKGYEGKIGGAA